MIALALALLSSPAFAATNPSLNCQAVHRFREGDSVRETQADLNVTFAAGLIVKYEGELGGKFFSLIEDQSAKSLLASITTPPDYIQGTVSRGNVDENGAFNMSQVDGTTVHRLQCRVRSR